MPTTKLIYGVGRIPKASEFALGEIIVNVDDSKVYSKDKSNNVFEIGKSQTTTFTSGFTTASIANSGFFTSNNTPNLIISGGTGINITTGSNNNIIITATGEAEATIVNANTASYILSTGIDGILFDFVNDSEQGDIYFDTNNILVNSSVGAVASGLSSTSNVTFAQVSSSGKLFASLSLDENVPNTVVYNPSTGQFYYTGSYGGGGSGEDNDWFIDTGVKLTSSLDIYVEGIISSSQYLVLKPIENTTGITGGFMYSSSNDFYLGFS